VVGDATVGAFNDFFAFRRSPVAFCLFFIWRSSGARLFSCASVSFSKPWKTPSRSINEGLGRCLGNLPAYGSCWGVFSCDCIGMYLYACLEYCVVFLLLASFQRFTIVSYAQLCLMNVYLQGVPGILVYPPCRLLVSTVIVTICVLAGRSFRGHL